MKCEIRTCHTSDGFELKFRHYAVGSESASDASRQDGPRQVVVAVHGIQSHSGWYRDSSAAIAQSGCEVYFADRRGSGLNGRDRGHADHGLRLLNDLKSLVHLTQKEHPNAAITLLGLSWGGKLASAFVASFPNVVQRLILLYPATDSRFRLSIRQSLLLKLARHHDVRRKLVPLPFTDPAWFSNVDEFKLRIQNDPLALNSVTTGFLNATRDLDKIIQRDGHRIDLPVLLMLAGNDRIVDNAKVKRRISQWPVSDFSLIEYENAEHTLEFCTTRQTFFQDMVYWLNRSLPTDAVQVPEATNQKMPIRGR